MNTDFWIERWKEGRIGFHEGQVNTLLAEHVERLGQGRRVLVPLCGKSEDLAFLAAQGHEVVGVELVEDAVVAFFAEHELTPTVERRGELAIYRAGAITLIAGDFFAVRKNDVGDISALYDRAAIIALPESMRRRYTAHVQTLVAPGATGLVITFEYPQEQMKGPPFSVTEAELRAHYAGVDIEVVGEQKASESFTNAGVDARSRVFVLRF